jgi:hypothetical protein
MINIFFMVYSILARVADKKYILMSLRFASIELLADLMLIFVLVNIN